MKHKWSDVIKAWADGFTIQFRRLPNSNKENDWRDWEYSFAAYQSPSWNDCTYEWRIKPSTKKITYRVAMMRSVFDQPDSVYLKVDSPFFKHFDSNLSEHPHFIKWISDEVTVEI